MTPEEIARHYAAAMDSVNLINAGQPTDMTAEEWADCLKRNQDHLAIMLHKDFWTTEDLQPFKDACPYWEDYQPVAPVEAPAEESTEPTEEVA